MHAKKIFGFEHFSSQIRGIEKNCLCFLQCGNLDQAQSCNMLC